jgi:hypothetical protein
MCAAKLTVGEFGEHLQSYFENKNDKIIYETIEIYKSGEADDRVQEMLLFFYSGIKLDDVKKFNHYFDIVNKSDDANLKKLFKEIKAYDIKQFLDAQNPSALLNDALWLLYFSSGDVKYLERLFIVIKDYYNEAEDLNNYLTGRSAIWSLKSNINNYPLVKKYFLANKILNSEIKDYIANNTVSKIHADTMEFMKSQGSKGVW